MAATIILVKCTSAAAVSETDVTAVGIRLTSVDDATTAPASAPITIPTANTAYSYETWLRFKATVAPDNQCANFQVWSLGTAIQTGAAKITLNSTAVTAGVTPVNTVSSAGTRTDLVIRTAGSKVAVAGTLTNTGAASETDYVVLQLNVYSTATQGNVTQTNEFSYSYDEN